MSIKSVQNGVVVTPTGTLGFIRAFTRKDGSPFQVVRILGRAVLKTDDNEMIRAQVQLDLGMAKDGLAPAVAGFTASRQACGAAGIDVSKWDGGIVGVVILPKDKSFRLAMATASEFEGENSRGIDLRAFTEDVSQVDTVVPEFSGATASEDMLRQLAAQRIESAARRHGSEPATVSRTSMSELGGTPQGTVAV